MEPRLACPKTVTLQAFVRGSLAEDAAETLVEHLERCSDCRDRLERLAGVRDILKGLTPRIEPVEGSADLALTRLLRELRSRTRIERLVFGGVSTGADPDDFPAPAFLSSNEVPSGIGRFGPYIILEMIGRDRSGETLRGYDPRLNRTVAIRVLSAALAASEPTRHRFLREAQAAAAVADEHVVTVHAIDETEGLPYFVMQDAGGISLHEAIDRSGLIGPEPCMRVGLGVARGLAAMHAQGLVHGDIKPANILLADGFEQIKITGFGTLAAIGDDELLRQEMIALPPHFQAPERCRGEPLDFRSDLFSLGTTLYATYTGRLPFEADSNDAVIRRIRDGNPDPILSLDPDVSAGLAAIVARLLAARSDERYQSALDVVDAFVRHLSGLSKSLSPAAKARDYEPARAHPRTLGRRQGWIGLSVVLVALLVVASATRSTKLAGFVRWVSHGRWVSAEPASFADQTPHANDCFSQAAAALRRSDDALAIALYTEGLRLDPSRVDAYIDRGVAWGRSGKFARAIADFTEALHLDPINSNVFRKCAEASRDTTDRQRAIDEVEELIWLKPNDALVYLFRGTCRSGRREFDAAMADYDEAVRLSPNTATIRKERGWFRLNVGETHGAIIDFDEAIRLDPKCLNARCQRAWAFNLLGKRDRAVMEINLAIQRAPSDAEAYTTRGRILLSARQFDDSLDDCNAAVRIDPGSVNARNTRASLYLQRGDPDRALSDLNEAIRQDPRDAGGYRQRGLAYSQKYAWDRALADYNECLRRIDPGIPAPGPAGVSLPAGSGRYDVWSRDTNYGAPLRERAIVLSLLGRYDASAAGFEQLLRLNPEISIDRSRRAHFLHTPRGEYDRAIRDCDAALQRAPRLAEAYMSRGEALLRKGELDQAIADFDRAFELQQGEQEFFPHTLLKRYPAVYLDRGDAFAAKGNLDRAVADYSEAIRLDPALKPAYLRRAEAFARLGQPSRANADTRAAANVQIHTAK